MDIEANVLRIAPDKLHEIHQECILVCQKTHLTKKQFQSLLGKLLYIQKCVKLSRIFVNRILALFRSHVVGKRIQLTGEFYQDLDWLSNSFLIPMASLISLRNFLMRVNLYILTHVLLVWVQYGEIEHMLLPLSRYLTLY